MLILSRKLDESIVIDGGITVTVIRMKGNVVQLGIDAPKEISIRRSELQEQIRENERTLGASKDKLDRGGRSLHDAVLEHRKTRDVETLPSDADGNRKNNWADATPFRRSGASGGNRKTTDRSWERNRLQR
jgi:carbon storage regulator